jgi:hypothetical protein
MLYKNVTKIVLFRVKLIESHLKQDGWNNFSSRFLIYRYTSHKLSSQNIILINYLAINIIIVKKLSLFIFNF